MQRRMIACECYERMCERERELRHEAGQPDFLFRGSPCQKSHGQRGDQSGFIIPHFPGIKAKMNEKNNVFRWYFGSIPLSRIPSMYESLINLELDTTPTQDDDGRAI